jgi:hypothetical protein
MIWRQKGRIGIRSYHQYFGHSKPMSIEQHETPLSTWSMGVDAVLPLEIFLESARVAHFNEVDQDETRDLNSNLLEEKCNKALAKVQKYQ